MKPALFPFQKWHFAVTALLLVHLFFLLSRLIHPPLPIPDSDEYLYAAKNIYTRGILYSGFPSEQLQHEYLTKRPPFYPLLLGLSVLTGSDIPVFLLQILMSMVSIFITYRIFFRDSKRFLLPGILLLLTTPAQFIYASSIMAETLFQFLIVLMAWSVSQLSENLGYIRARRKNNFIADRHIWLFMLLFTLGMATKPVLYPFLVIIIPLSILLFIKSRRRSYLFALILPLLWITLYGIRNYHRTSSLQYSSIQTTNMLNYNLRYYLMDQYGSEAASETIDSLYETCGERDSYRAKNNCLSKKARKIIMEHPMKYGVFHLKGCARFFFDPGRFDLVTFFHLKPAGSSGFLYQLNAHGVSGAILFLTGEGWKLVIILALIFLFKIIKITGFLLYIFRGKADLPLRIFLILLVGYLSLVTGPLGASRFLLPVELFLIAGAIKGWISLVKDLRDRYALSTTGSDAGITKDPVS